MRRIVLFSLAVAASIGVARAQNGGPEIIVVPYAPGDPRLPYPAHEGARLTLKAMLRNANCAQGYRVAWDVNRNDTFDDDTARDVTPTDGSVYDIGRTFTVPAVDADSSTPINVRVTDRCTNQQLFASQRIFTYNWYPSNDPRDWTAEQTEIMAQMALHEALWYLHRWTGNRAGQGAQITGSLIAGGNAAAGGALTVWAYAINGRLPAYPPGTIDRHGVQLPANWEAANDARWRNDPYAETSIRLLNTVLARGTARVAINGADEGTTCGYNGDGTERHCNRLPGTTNAMGAYSNGGGNNVYYQGVTLGSMAPVLPALAGTPVQVGGLAGTTYEVLIQEMTDYLAYQQISGGCGKGGWYYSAIDGSGDCGIMDASTAQWGYIGLESARSRGSLTASSSTISTSTRSPRTWCATRAARAAPATAPTAAGRRTTCS
jgi:hypothetical protein